MPAKSFDSFVQTKEKLSPFTVWLTSITQEDVCMAPNSTTAWSAILKYAVETQAQAKASLSLGGDTQIPSVFLAHNGRTFDFDYILRTCLRSSIDLEADLRTVGIGFVADSLLWLRLVNWDGANAPYQPNKVNAAGKRVPCYSRPNCCAPPPKARL